jgi:phosphotransferase family enzyme
LLYNPEREWWPAPPPVARAEVERRIGPTGEALVPLSGGFRNINVRVGDERVLRIHRDPELAAREAAILRHDWRSFVVPEVLDVGADFVVLRWVEHAPLAGTAEEGAAAGRALAEIHATRPDGLVVSDADPIGRLYEYLDFMAREPSGLGPLRERVRALLDARERELRAMAGAPVFLHSDFKASNLHRTRGGELLVLDWEHAWVSARWLDIAQLLRWGPPEPFVRAFADAYGGLDGDWRRTAAMFDLFYQANGAGSEPDTARARAVAACIERTLAMLESR